MKKVITLFAISTLLFATGCDKASDESIVKSSVQDIATMSSYRSLSTIREIAENAAENFVGNATKSRSSISNEIVSLVPYSGRMTKSSDDLLCYVVNYAGGGFSIVGARKDMPEILVFSEDGDYATLNSSNDGFKMYMDDMLSQLSSLGGDDIDMPEIVYTKIDSTRTTSFNYPLLSVLWHQSEPFNWYCNSCPAGCVAIAMGQIMSVFSYPENINLSFPEAPSPSIDLNWEEVKNSTHFSEHSMSCEYCKQEALLIREIGQRVGMLYDNDGSGAESSRVVPAFQTFGYESSSYSSYYLDGLLMSLNKKFPVYIRGEYHSGENKSGHAWVADGSKYSKLEKRFYDVSSKTGVKTLKNVDNIEDWYLHFNYGWGGSGYYLAQRKNLERGIVI